MFCTLLYCERNNSVFNLFEVDVTQCTNQRNDDDDDDDDDELLLQNGCPTKGVQTYFQQGQLSRFLPSQISDTPSVGFETAQKVSLIFGE